ncbi:hypothetical protein [Pyrobaculum neutrophilum]|uniref:Uncharacterized protein n=1 Tax=Pyrobaculum neutrophilum (strain DSM 2338 / JCM 9278 / NBRC 100436 / V24Sta) TaxID=444157 RepID=B1YDM2_PYRNV|nr:hypothetical protein [Pyrobaculum neutrophilum]ACB39885.1 conserved hypothetical protein [Pyrobaculum neutrophilum V24Sta]
MRLRPPPRIKVLEALGAVADGRVKVLGPGRCEVVSSEGDRVYRVEVAGGRARSDDNGTVYRGYVGYPIIACLMAEGRLPVDPGLAERLRGVAWRRLNERFGRYEEVLRHIYAERAIDRASAERYIDEVLKLLGEMRLERAAP